MTLEQLRVKLDAAKTGNAIVQVVFDYSAYMNKGRGNKTYPLALWDFNNIKFDWNRRSDVKYYTIHCWGVIDVTPEDDLVKRHVQWDTIQAAMAAYLTAVEGQADLTVENADLTSGEFYPAGFLSLDREMGIRYEVELKLWC